MKAGSSAGGVKEMLLRHAEKLVLGVACILVALLLWSAMGVKPIEASKSPDRLKTDAAEQIVRIDSSEPPPPPREQTSFSSAVLAGLQPVVDTSAYAHTVKIDPELQPAIVKRPEPVYLAVEGLTATAAVASIPVEGTPPTWTEPTKEKEKKKAVKKEPKINPEGVIPQRRGRRGKTGYGGGGAGYGGVGYGAAGATAAAKKAAGADAAQDSGGGYGKATHTPQVGYGASSESKGYGAVGYGGVGYGASGRGGSGYGAAGMTMGGPHPGVQVVGQQVQGEVRHAVVLTGRVPFAKQFEEFQKKFKEAEKPESYTPEMDFPKYLQFKVERQEVAANGEGKWTEVDLDAAEKAEASWFQMAAQELVDPPYIYSDGAVPVLAWPMPPTIQRDWLRLSTHPSIPLAGMDVDVTTQTLGGSKRDWTPTDSRRRRPGAAEGLEGDLTGKAPFSRDAAGPYGQPTDQPLVAPVPSYLFRFVDTEKLEPGKQYRYRVSVEVLNPNYMVAPGILEDASSSRQEGRWTPPSDPSAAVTIPRDRTLIALRNKSSSPTDQTAHFQFHIWDKKMGAEIAKEFALELGEVADFVDTVEDWYNPYTGTSEKLENVTFRFDDGPPMLADVDGGTGLPGARGAEQPTELLLIDGKGRLFTSNEAFEAPTAEYYKERYVSTSATPADTTDGSILDSGGKGGLVPQNFGGRR
jgi:hypothetical protein